MSLCGCVHLFRNYRRTLNQLVAMVNKIPSKGNCRIEDKQENVQNILIRFYLLSAKASRLSLIAFAFLYRFPSSCDFERNL